MEIDIPKETKIGEKIKDEIQKNIILMIILILMSVPMFNFNTWYDPITIYQKGIE